METIELNVEPLTVKAFEAFGDVIEVNDTYRHFTINEGFSERYHDLAQLDLLQQGGRALVNIFRTKPKSFPIQIEQMESHPLSSQAFIPLGEEPYLVVVAPRGTFNEEAIKVFLAQSNQGVNYHAGIWHHYSLALNKRSDFLVIDRGADDENCIEVRLKKVRIIKQVTR